MKYLNHDKMDQLLTAIADHDDQSAFRKFFNLFYTKLLNYAYYILESRQDADEVVSTIFLKIWEQRQKLPGIKKLDNYLYTSVKNQCCNYLRDNREFCMKPLETTECRLVPAFENPEKQYLDIELKEQIVEAVEQLPPRCRLIFRMIREDGMKYSEAAELLELSIKTVEVQMGRAYAKMREILLPLVQQQSTDTDNQSRSAG